MPQKLLLMFVVMPIWLAAGIADWILHRRTHIEATAGMRESVLHMIMLAEMGAMVVVVIVFEVNAGVLALCLVALAAHELTVYADLRWAAPRRLVAPLEQMVHSVQEMLPLAAIFLLASVHWDEALALVGLGSQRDATSFVPVLRRDPLPAAYLYALMASCLVVTGCYMEELWRCVRAARASDERRG